MDGEGGFTPGHSINLINQELYYDIISSDAE
jgi:hypothetical protein